MTIPPAFTSNTIVITLGDDFEATRVMNDVPVNQGVSQATWTVKKVDDLSTPGDATAVWQKTITSTDNAGVGQIEASGAGTGKAVLRWEGTYLESVLGVPGVEYVYDMQLVSTASKVFTMEKGTLVFDPQVTTI